MATTTTPGVRYQYRKQQGYIDLVNDTLKAALMNDAFTYEQDKDKAFTAPEWAPGFYSIGDTVISTSSDGAGFIFMCVDHGSGSEGSTDSAEPLWPVDETDPFGNQVVDGDIVWEVWSYDLAVEEISSNGGYTRDTLTQEGSDTGPVEDYNNNLSYVHYDDIYFEADSSGALDPTKACIIYDETDPQKTVIAAVIFDSTYTVRSGNYLTLQDPEIEDEAVSQTV